MILDNIYAPEAAAIDDEELWDDPEVLKLLWKALLTILHSLNTN